MGCSARPTRKTLAQCKTTTTPYHPSPPTKNRLRPELRENMAKKAKTGTHQKTQILGIDPGISGALVLTNGELIMSWPMPIVSDGKNKSVEFDGVHEILDKIVTEFPDVHVYLERAVPMAMGSKHAFTYGMGFAAIVIALELHKVRYTLIEPQRWAKEMHEGISADLKPKAKSAIAVKRLFPRLAALLPTKPKGGMHDGFIDALLIAGYGLRKASPVSKAAAQDDFY